MGDGESFEVKVELHQGSVLSPLLFAIVMEVMKRDTRRGLPWEILYADDLVLMAMNKKELIKKIQDWSGRLEEKGLKMNTGKTKIMESQKSRKKQVKNGRWPCSVCRKGVGRNAIRCSKCKKWVHKKCSGIKNKLEKFENIFVCRVCGVDKGRSMSD